MNFEILSHHLGAASALMALVCVAYVNHLNFIYSHGLEWFYHNKFLPRFENDSRATRKYTTYIFYVWSFAIISAIATIVLFVMYVNS